MRSVTSPLLVRSAPAGVSAAFPIAFPTVALPVPILLADAEQTVVDVNDCFVEEFDVPAATLLGQSLAGLFGVGGELLRGLAARAGESARPALLTDCEMRLPGAAPARVDLRVGADGGQWVLAVLRRAPPQGAAGAGYRLLAAAIENSPIPWTLQGPDYRLVLVNAAYCRLAGYRREELIGRDPIEWHPPEVQAEMRRLRDSVGAHVRAAVGAGTMVTRELIHRNGRRVPYRMVVGNTLDDRGTPLIHCQFFDLRAERRLRGRVRSHRDWVHEVFEQAPVGMLLTGPDGRSLANAMAHRMLGEDDDDRIASLLGVSPERHGGPAVGQTGRTMAVVGEPPAMVTEPDAILRAPPAIDGAPDDLVAPVPSTPALGGRRRLTSDEFSPDLHDGSPPAVLDAARSVAVSTPTGRRWFECRQVAMRDSDGRGDQVLTVFTEKTRELELAEEVRGALSQQSAILRCVSAGLAHVVGEIIVQVNREMERLAGRPEAHLVGQPLEALFDDVDWAAVRAHLDGDEADGAYSGTVSVRGRDGQRWQGRLTVRWVEQGRPDLGVLVMFADMSDLIRRSARLQASVEHMRRYLDAQPVGTAQVRGDRIAHANTTLCRLLGLDAHALVGRGFASLFEAGEAVASALASVQGGAAAAGEPVLQVTLRAGSGGPRDALLLLTPIEGSAEVIATLVDLNQLRALADRAARDEARFEGFARLSDDAMLIVEGPQAIVRFVNRRAEEMTGLRPDDMLGRPMSALADIVSPPDRGLVGRAYGELLESGGGTASLLISTDTPAHGPRTLRVRLFAKAGLTSECFVMLEDVTETLRLERARLEEALAQRDLLVREVHHRIKNNLQGVSGLLHQVGVERPEVARWLEDAARQIEAIARVYGLEVRTGESILLRRFVDAVVGGSHLDGRLDSVRVDYAPIPEIDHWRLPQSEVVPMALILNELLANAGRHGPPGQPCRVAVGADGSGAWIHVINAGGLPAGFDFATLPRGATGLGLVKALLPRRGAALRFTQADGETCAALSLQAPVVRAVPEPGAGGAP